MENTDKPKKKIPLFPKFKTNVTIQKYKGNSMFSDSSNSNILEDSSDQDTYEDNNYLCCSNKDVLKTQNLMSEEIDKIDISRANNSLYITPKKIIDDFREIEEFLAKNTYYKKNSCKINENKNKEKSPEKKNNKKEKDKDKDKDKDNIKIINDFFINNEGDPEFISSSKRGPRKFVILVFVLVLFIKRSSKYKSFILTVTFFNNVFELIVLNNPIFIEVVSL